MKYVIKMKHRYVTGTKYTSRQKRADRFESREGALAQILNPSERVVKLVPRPEFFDFTDADGDRLFVAHVDGVVVLDVNDVQIELTAKAAEKLKRYL